MDFDRVRDMSPARLAFFSIFSVAALWGSVSYLTSSDRRRSVLSAVLTGGSLGAQGVAAKTIYDGGDTAAVVGQALTSGILYGVGSGAVVYGLQRAADAATGYIAPGPEQPLLTGTHA